MIIGIIILLILAIVIILLATTNKEDSNYEYGNDYKYDIFTKHEIKKAGKKGETNFNILVRKVLKENDIHLNNIILSTNGKEIEIDNIIINENGIFIIEVKNYKGKLYGDVDDYKWIKRKISPGGEVFKKEVYNPIKQVKTQTYHLSQYLKNNNIWIWIEPYVYFANDNSPVINQCVIHDEYELDRIIHTKKGKTYKKESIYKALHLLSNQ